MADFLVYLGTIISALLVLFHLIVRPFEHGNLRPNDVDALRLKAKHEVRCK